MSAVEEDNGVDKTTKLVQKIVGNVDEGDLVLFNDRTVPLTVQKVKQSSRTESVEIKGQRGGVYKFSLTGQNGSFNRATGETGRFGLRFWESKTLTDAEVVDTHTFRFGNVYKRNIENEYSDVSSLYVIITGETDEYGSYITVDVHVYKGSIISVDEGTLSKTYHKPKVFNGGLEQVGSIPRYCYDTEREEYGKVIDFGKRDDTSGVYVSYKNGDNDYVPYEEIVPTSFERLEAVDPTKLTN